MLLINANFNANDKETKNLKKKYIENDVNEIKMSIANHKIAERQRIVNERSKTRRRKRRKKEVRRNMCVMSVRFKIRNTLMVCILCTMRCDAMRSDAVVDISYACCSCILDSHKMTHFHNFYSRINEPLSPLVHLIFVFCFVGTDFYLLKSKT